MGISLSNADAPARKLRWHQFHLRTLMLVVTDVAICCGLIARLGPEEQEFRDKYANAPILGPVAPSGPLEADDPPSDDEVMAALERDFPVPDGVTMLWEHKRGNVRIVKDKLADYIDPPRNYPLIGPAQLHNEHYKCTVYFTPITQTCWPLRLAIAGDEAQEVVYIFRNHFHMVDKAWFEARSK
jgi:hypothetical protein